MKKIKAFITFFLLIVMVSCKGNVNKESFTEETERPKTLQFKTSLINTSFDTIIDLKPVKLYWLKNDDVRLAITNLGGRFVGLWVKDVNGEFTDVVVGHGSAKDYVNSGERYFGATIGRVGNRIAKGKFRLNGETFNIPINNGENSLHGGKNGFQEVVWDAEQHNNTKLILRYLSPDMEEGFPGNLQTQVTYSLIEGNIIKMEYQATTDRPTIVNLTNHAFFNLNGEGSGTILNHKLQIYADKYTPVEQGLIPTGKIEDLKGTPFDFTTPRTIGQNINVSNKQLEYGGGYDHNYVLNQTKSRNMNHAATIVGDKTNIQMEVFTIEPGLQFYSGNFMQSENIFKSGAKDDYRTAFCLETQHFPDSPNQSNFPSIVLNPNETYYTVSEYQFSIK
ncbi:galactose mutarotase [Aureibaculum algae]|uniref:Aldose 1-epimerase n=1 Tax=Aureibaculum algae TaxID=2584122 RepID=A0A5B7TQK7_9FLAO|nr:aldose epimerase family protein [Aureibaculum algae]QCX37426.1 galactose mutarotase [Aureibaculum algae]